MVTPVLAVVPFTGSEKLVEMTARMAAELRPMLGQHDRLVLVANNPSRDFRPAELPTGVTVLHQQRNLGFGPGINAAIRELNWRADVLVLNNDLSFPQPEWFRLLRTEQGEDERDNLSYVYAPRTNCTATREAIADGPEDKPAQRVRQVSAYCWLVPAKMLERLRPRAGFELFPPEFPNYGSDDAAAIWLRFLFGGTPFKVVHRAFVKHAKGQTAKETGDRPGDPQVLKRLREYERRFRK